jgi:hypothetical protein
MTTDEGLSGTSMTRVQGLQQVSRRSLESRHE